MLLLILLQDSEHVYELVYCSHRAVAQAAGDFLNVRLFSEQDVDPDIRTRRGKKRLENTPHIRGNIEMILRPRTFSKILSFIAIIYY